MAKNKKIKEVDLSKQRDEICFPVAQEVLKIIAESKPMMGEGDRGKFMESYQPTVKKILELYLEKDIDVGYLAYIKTLVLQPIDWAMNVTESSMNKNLQLLQVKTFGKEVGEMKMTELDARLKRPAAEGTL